MEYHSLQAALAIGGAFCLYWGFSILLSDSYFTRWQNTHWKESNDEQWSNESMRYNKFVRPLCTIGLGVGLLYLLLFPH